MLVAAGLPGPAITRCISLLALNGLRVSEATGADIERLGLERGHRTLTIVARAARSSRSHSRPAPHGRSTWRSASAAEGPIFLGTDGGASTATPPGGSSAASPAGRDHQASRTPHPAPHVHHRRPRRRRSAPRRPRSRQPRRPPHDHALRPRPRLARPPRHLHRRPRSSPAPPDEPCPLGQR